MKRVLALYHCWRRTERGQNLVEFAFTLPVLMLLLLGTIDIGLGFRTYISLSNAAREGVRWVSIYPNDCAGAAARVASEADRVNLAPNDDESVSGDGYTLSSLSCPYSAGQKATVTIDYEYDLLFGIIPGLTAVPFRTSATMVVLYDE